MVLYFSVYVHYNKSDNLIFFAVFQDPPTVSIPLSEYTAPVGDKVTINCEVSANPPATRVYWKRNDGRIVTSSERYSQISPSSPSLTITDLQTVDIGGYQCFAENQFGVSSDTTALKVTRMLCFFTINDIATIHTSTMIEIKTPEQSSLKNHSS